MSDLLPSWRDGDARRSIIHFVETSARKESTGYIVPEERIAVFDNDGTLWSEQPFYIQGLFLFNRLKKLLDQHPGWKETQPFKAAIEHDWKTLAGYGQKGLLDLVLATHAGMTSDEFTVIVTKWLEQARHPQKGVPYLELVYQPMIELLDYLRSNGFKTFIVSGGGIEFVRTFSQRIYGVPPEQVIGSSIVTKFEIRDNKPVLIRQPKINFIDDGDGKPVGINQHIGRRPVMAFGNSDGDLAMFQWVAAGAGPSFIGLLHHTDSEREWAYDRDSPSGRLVAAIDEARKRCWTVVDMQRDWARVFPHEPLVESFT